MAAQAGWYPAGVPGRERWWDGIQWTEHERYAAVQPPPPPAPAAPAPAPAYAAVPQHPVPQPGYSTNPGYAVVSTPAQPAASAMAWYVFPPSGQPRWWNGTEWTAYHVKNGRPTAEAYVTEPPSMGWALGGLFVVVGLLNLLRAHLNPSGVFLGILFLALAALWMIGAGRDLARRKIPAPITAPIVEDSLRPFPGETEGIGAGWYPVTGAIMRWWTGTRWAHYVVEKGRVRPTQFGPRSYRLMVIATAVFGALGVVGLLVGIVLTAASPDPFVGIALIIVGVVFALVAGVLWLVTYLRRYALLLPPSPPQLG